jgi:hypothetical protein
MSLKIRLEQQLKSARRFSESMLASFKTPEEWTHQVHAQANHALWFVGHLGVVDTFAISVLDPSKAKGRSGYQQMFGMGSQPTPNAEDYPPVEEVLEFMKQQRATLLEILQSLEEEDLDRPTPEGTPDFLPDFASVFQTMAWHEGLHAGQVTVARRSLGNAPMKG